MRHLFITFGFVLILMLIASRAAADPIEWANGAWGIDVDNIPEGLTAEQIDERRNCKSTPVLISTDRKSMRYKAVHTGEKSFVSNSPILESTSHYLSLQYDGEERLMKNGELSKWHMFFVTPDKFYWVLGEGVSEGERDGIIPVARVRCQTYIG